MKTLFICLANSKKFGERCIAGVEVKKVGEVYKTVEKEGKPKWLRPISECQYGAVAEDLVGGINLMDIIEIDVKELCPNGYAAPRRNGELTLTRSALGCVAARRNPTLNTTYSPDNQCKALLSGCAAR